MSSKFIRKIPKENIKKVDEIVLIDLLIKVLVIPNKKEIWEASDNFA